MFMREGRRVIPFLAILMILLFQCTVFTNADARKKTPPKKSQTTETTLEENVSGEVIQADASQPAAGDKTDTAAPPAGGDKTDTAAPPAKTEPGSTAPAVNDGKTEGGNTETPKAEGNETKDTPAASPTPEEGAPAPKAGEEKKEASETPSPEGTNEVAPRITAVVIDGNNSVSTDEIIQVISTRSATL